MKKYKLKQDSIAISQEIWIGIDAHKKTLHFSVINEDDEVLWQNSVPHGRSHVQSVIDRLPGCKIVAVYESGPTGYSLRHWLKEMGCTAFVTPVSKVPENKGGKQIKTDKRDSLQLARLARAGLLDEVHDLGKERYCQRELTRTREQLMQQRSKICSQIKSKLVFHSIETPKGMKSNWSKKYLAWLANNPSGNPSLDVALNVMVGMYRALTTQIKRLDKEIKELAETDEFEEEVELLTTVPQVGVLTAMIFLLELGDISRFDRCEEFSSFLGLVPGEWSTGEKRRQTSRVRWGNKRARTALVETSWWLIGKDPRMRKTYDRIKYRSGHSGTAIVAVARRLGLAMRAMLREGKAYDYPGAQQEKTEEAES